MESKINLEKDEAKKKQLEEELKGKKGHLTTKKDEAKGLKDGITADTLTQRATDGRVKESTSARAELSRQEDTLNERNKHLNDEKKTAQENVKKADEELDSHRKEKEKKENESSIHEKKRDDLTASLKKNREEHDTKSEEFKTMEADYCECNPKDIR